MRHYNQEKSQRILLLEQRICSLEDQIYAGEEAVISSESVDGASVSYSRSEAVEFLNQLRAELRALRGLECKIVDAHRAFILR